VCTRGGGGGGQVLSAAKARDVVVPSSLRPTGLPEVVVRLPLSQQAARQVWLCHQAQGQLPYQRLSSDSHQVKRQQGKCGNLLHLRRHKLFQHPHSQHNGAHGKVMLQRQCHRKQRSPSAAPAHHQLQGQPPPPPMLRGNQRWRCAGAACVWQCTSTARRGGVGGVWCGRAHTQMRQQPNSPS